MNLEENASAPCYKIKIPNPSVVCVYNKYDDFETIPIPADPEAECSKSKETKCQALESGNETKTELVVDKYSFGWRRYIGIVFMLLACLTLSLVALIVKLLNKGYHPITLTFWRYTGQLDFF